MIHGDSKIAPLWESHLYALVKDDTGSPPLKIFQNDSYAHVLPQLDFEIGNSPFGNEIFIVLATFHSNSKFFLKLF